MSKSNYYYVFRIVLGRGGASVHNVFLISEKSEWANQSDFPFFVLSDFRQDPKILCPMTPK